MKIKKRLLSILLSLVLVLGLMPGMSLTAYADGNVAKVGETEYATLRDALNNWTDGTTLTLLDDVTITSCINVDKNKTLDLNGHTITLNKTGGDQRVINVEAKPSVTFDLRDSSGTNAGKLTGVNAASDAWSGALYVGLGATVNMYGGTITGNNASWGAGVWVDARNHPSSGRNGGTFNMYGGVITGNSGTNGAGVGVHYQWSNNCNEGIGHFNMYGGTIVGNTSTDGNDVKISNGIMTMTGGTIGDFSNSNYVAVTFDANNGTGTMSNQYVKKNTATIIKANVNYDTNGAKSDPALSREGYTFAGWNTQANGSGTNYTAGTDSINVSANTTLYAQWTAIPATAPTINSATGATLSYGYTEGSISVTATAATDTTYNDLTYQWYSNTTNSTEGGTAITENGTSATYTIPIGKTAGTTEYYYCVVTATRSDNGQTATATSSVATVTVNTKAMTVSAEDVNATVDGQPHGITVNVTDPATGYTVKYGTTEGSYTLDASPTQTEVGEKTVYYQVTADNYTTYTGSAKVTVSAKSAQTITAADVTATYGDTDKSVSASVTDPAQGGGAITYAVKDGSGDYIDVDATTGALSIKAVPPTDGKAYVIVTAAETSTYAQATKEVTVTINKANAVAATVTANNRTYDGTAQPLVTVTGEPTGGTMQYALGTETEATEQYTTSIPTATNAGTYYVWYKVKGDKDHLDSEPACVEAAIAKRNVTLTSAEDSKDYDGKPLTNNNITVTGDGWAEGEGATYNVTGTQILPGASDNGFTYTLNNNTKEHNYNISKVINKLTVNDRTEKYEINVEVNSDNVTYDGNEHEVSGFKTLEFLCDDVTYTVSGLSASVIGTDAGTYDVVVTGTPLVKNSDDKDLTKQFIVNIVPGQLVIDTRNVSFTSASETKQYDGEPLTNDNVEITGDGFAEGEGASFDVTGNQLVVGSSANTFTYTLNEGTNPDNYSITSQEGTLTVTNRLAKYEIIPKANSGEFTYDGSEHSVTGFVTDTFEVATDDETTHIYTLSGLTAEGTGTDVGEYTVNITGTPVVIDAEGNDVSSEFSVIPVAGNIVINKRNVTLTSASDSKAYDGKELTNEEVTVSGDGWAEGEGAEYKVTGTRKLPGETRNSFTYTLNEGTNADNYEITSVEGTLTITDRKAEDEEGSDKDVRYEITVVANSGNFTYDGTEHEVSGVESTEFTINDVTYTVSGLEASAKGTEVGTYPVKISGTPVVTDADGNDLTKQFTVNTKEGTLTVVEKSVNPEGDIRYSNYSGDRVVWTKGSNAGCEFVFKRSVDDELTFGHFTGIDVESKAVDASNYTAVSGSVVITLKPEYLETLAVGDHLLTANFDDGNSVTVKFTIKEKSEEKKSDTTLNNKKADVTPETGDTVNVQLIFLVMVLSMCVIFALCNLRSKLDEKKRRR